MFMVIVYYNEKWIRPNEEKRHIAPSPEDTRHKLPGGLFPSEYTGLCVTLCDVLPSRRVDQASVPMVFLKHQSRGRAVRQDRLSAQAPGQQRESPRSALIPLSAATTCSRRRSSSVTRTLGSDRAFPV